MKKRLISMLLCVSMICALAVGCGSKEEEKKDETTQTTETTEDEVIYDLTVGQMGTLLKPSMIILANEMGFFEEEGLNVTFEAVTNNNDALTAITTGKLDIYPYGSINTCTFISQGADLCVFGGTIVEGCAAICEKDRVDEFADLSGLEGKSVGCVRSDTGQIRLKSAITDAGIDLTTVEFVELDNFQSVTEAVLKGTVDMGLVNNGFEIDAQRQGLAVPFLIGDYAPSATCCLQTASKTSIEENREAYVRFQIANLEAYKLMLEDSETTIKTLAAYSGQTEDYVKEYLYDSAMVITMDPAAKKVVDFYDVLKEQGEIAADTTVDMAEFVDSSIYYDALTEMISRYPDYEPFQKLMEEYEVNN